DNLDEFIHGKTLIMVTHRRYLIKYFDRVLVMKGGKIIRDCSPGVFQWHADGSSTVAK
ncbi:hypothetical protein MJN69_28490, partial [Salmonella enterica subsp. enterica serovar Kentucky]|nr:hypothetical protein [Salmonella enterica subsp. enterica serovar Kentucky]